MGEKRFFYLDPDDRKWKIEDTDYNWETIVDIPEKTNTLEGTFLLKDGQVFEWSELLSRCMVCLDLLSYNEEHDSEFCAACDEWREDSCSDPNCEYCLARPKKPSDCDQ